nr:PREDICTED: protein PIN-LIKES 3-like isoform X1 [Musa acuminata subsp. malaccensis]
MFISLFGLQSRRKADDMGLLKLFVTASVPVLKVLLVTGVGSFLATGQVGILCHEARKHLNNVVFYVFNPALVSTNLSRTITMESLVLLWFMPINILLTFIIGFAFGWVVIQITNAPSHLKGLVLGCCAAGNLGNMLLIIVPAICKERGSPFGASDVCTTYGLAYASLSMAIGAIFLWSFVYNIVRISSGATEGKATAYSDTQEQQIIQETEKLVSQSCLDRTLPIEHTYLPGDECVLTLSASEIPQNELKFQVSFSDKARQLLSNILKIIDLKKLFAPSTVGVIIGFIIGVVPQIRKAVIGETAPLRVIQDSADLLGEGAIPTLTLIMGGNLIKGLRGSGIRFSLILGVVIVRYIMLPLVGILVVKGAINLGLLHQDPLYHFILLLQYALPPAMNIGTITQLFGAGESECSVIFLWTYSLASVSLTLWSTYFMWLVSTD